VAYQVFWRIVGMSQVTEACSCPVKGIIDVVSKKWTLLIVNTLGIHDTLRFKDLTSLLGISPKTLSDTLKILVEQKLVIRVSYNTIPPKVEYSLTIDGHEFRKAILPLLRWAASRDDGIQEPCVPGCKRHING
jgi:DNA-binding HxlR family transcriptional regulator